MVLVENGRGDWTWQPRPAAPKAAPKLPASTARTPAPIVQEPCVFTKPVTVVDTPGITIKEFFGIVASKDGTASFALADVHRADEAAFQAPRFAEYVVITKGSLDLHTVHADGAQLTKTHVAEGEGVYLPAGLRVKWSWPEPCQYTVVCVPAFSPLTAGSDLAAEGGPDTVIDSATRTQLAQMHNSAGIRASAPRHQALMVLSELPAGLTPLVVKPVAVVEAPGITIHEHFGNVASHDAAASLGRAVVKGPAQEAWQTPGFDEFVICTKGSIEFYYGDGKSKSISAGQGIFLPNHLRVKWVWPEATDYTVLCLPAFTPELCGREAEESATNAKDSASMERLQRLHAERS